MVVCYRSLYLRLALALLLLGGHTAQAQREYFNWYFGYQAGITFNSAPAQGLSSGQGSFPHGAACISDSTGQFVLASDGFTIWNRQWQVIMVRQPGPGRRYYVLRASTQLRSLKACCADVVYLPYAVVDLNANNGLGAVVQRDSLELPQQLPGPRYLAAYYYRMQFSATHCHHSQWRPSE